MAKRRSSMNLPTMLPAVHSEEQRKVIGHMSDQEGWTPALMVRDIIQAPIFNAPKRANLYLTQRLAYRYDFKAGHTYYAETANTLPIERRKDNGGGLLRWLDLDILVALSHHWTVTGSPSITCEQRTILEWMGYKNLDEAPYRELRASVRRMSNTTISLYHDGMKKDDYPTYHLLDTPHGGAKLGNGRGNYSLLQATLSNSWLEAIKNNWQVIDAGVYGLICKTNKLDGLARALYLFLLTLRREDNSFQVPIGWLRDRYGDRKFSAKFPEGKFVYANPVDKRSRLAKSMETLISCGAVSFEKINYNPNTPYYSKVIGKFMDPGEAARLPGPEPEQLTLFNVSKLTGEVEEPEAVPEATVKETIEQLSNVSNGKVAAEQTLINPEDQILKNIRKALGLSSKAVESALTRGWQKKEVVLCMAWVYYRRERYDNPAGAVRSIFDDLYDDEEGRQQFSQEKLKDKMGDDFEKWIEQFKNDFYPDTIKQLYREQNPLKYLVLDTIDMVRERGVEFKHEIESNMAEIKLEKIIKGGRLDRLPLSGESLETHAELYEYIKAQVHTMLIGVKETDADQYLEEHWPY